MIEKGKRRRRQAKSNHHCGEARVLTIEAMNEIEETITAQKLQESIAKERRLALYGKGKFAQLVWKEMPVRLDIFQCQNHCIMTVAGNEVAGVKEACNYEAGKILITSTPKRS